MPVILGGNTGIYLASLAPSVDPDAQAFITAAAITDPTQQSAINTLVVDLKGYNIWTKMKALYPFVGGTSTSTSYNLVNTALYQISWSGGVTWGANGVQFGGINGYGNTGLNQLSVLSQNSQHISFYSRTNTDANLVDIGLKSIGTAYTMLQTKYSNTFTASVNEFYVFADHSANTNSQGFYVGNRTGATVRNNWKNGSKVHTSSSASQTQANFNFFVGAYNNAGTAANYTNRQCAFASIGDGLTDTEAANFYTAVQAFQTTLGRSIGTQTVSDADAQAFVTNAGIVDQVEANAVNNLVIGLKADSLWTKMKAVYPFVGGTASQHKWNLKDPRDLDAAFRLVFAGDVIHSSNGALFNSVTANGFADTKLASSGTLAQNSTHFSAYSRTNNTSGGYIMANGNAGASGECKMFTRWFDNNCYSGVNTFGQVQTANSDSRGYFIANRISATQHSVVIRGTKIDFNTNSSGLKTDTFRICSALSTAYDNKEIAFASIGDGLTNTELTNLNTRVTTFQTALNRNV